MRKKDLPIILATAIVAGIFAYIFTNFLIVPDADRSEEVEVVEPITSEFRTVDERYFNENSINPTQLIEIGGGDIDVDDEAEE